MEVAECHRVYVRPPQPVEEEEPLPRSLCDGVSVVGPCQVQAGLNPDEPEAVSSPP